MVRQGQPYHPVDQCRWSVPAFRPSLLSDDDDAFVRYWVCERTMMALPVSQEDCANCQHWSPERAARRTLPRRS
jgi:hypothetical protein